MADPSKSEKATPRRRQEYRKKGSVAKSVEVNTLFILLLAYFMFRIFGRYIFNVFNYIMKYYLSNVHSISIGQNDIRGLLTNMFFVILMVIGPFLIAFVLSAIFSNLIQVGFFIAKEAIKPSLNKLNPISGAKNILSAKSLESLLKSLLKVFIISYFSYIVIKKNFFLLIGIYHLPISQGFFTITQVAGEILLRIILGFIVIAAADFGYQKFNMEQKMKMTKQEIKDERKRIEGNPEIKAAIKRKQMEMARSRMMADVPKADVVVTNPIHVAVAIHYDATKMSAPRIMAKGMRKIAEQIKKIAAENDIPIVENPPLARDLFRSGKVNKDIPYELYSAVAEVLTYVHKLSGKSFGV